MPEYPPTVAECLDDSMRFRVSTLNALRMYRSLKPWRGDDRERERKLRVLHEALCIIYRVVVPLVVECGGGDSGGSSYNGINRTITLRGRLSVVTYLHEFAHALGKLDEREACRWSINLFRRVFPREFDRLAHDGHTLRRQPARGRGNASKGSASRNVGSR